MMRSSVASQIVAEITAVRRRFEPKTTSSFDLSMSTCSTTLRFHLQSLLISLPVLKVVYSAELSVRVLKWGVLGKMLCRNIYQPKPLYKTTSFELPFDMWFDSKLNSRKQVKTLRENRLIKSHESQISCARVSGSET